jgi:hypothetical protein
MAIDRRRFSTSSGIGRSATPRSCPVRLSCLEEALLYEERVTVGERAGMFGALTPRQRRELARERRRARVATA